MPESTKGRMNGIKLLKDQSKLSGCKISVKYLKNAVKPIDGKKKNKQSNLKSKAKSIF